MKNSHISKIAWPDHYKRDEVMNRADSDIVKYICRSCTLGSEVGHRSNLANKGK